MVDRVVPVKPLNLSPQEQLLLDRESRRMHLYYCRSCPASIAVKRYCERLGLRVVEKEVERVNAFRNELVNGGGESRVPCLRIDSQDGESWLYSPELIYHYMHQRFGPLLQRHNMIIEEQAS